MIGPGAFIRDRLPLTCAPFVPEVRLHKAAPTSGLGRLAEADEAFGSPYWAYFWGGGLALARYVLDHPEMVRGRRVLDLGAGSGMVAIAAALAGAAEVLAADVDPYALAAVQANAEANGVVVRTHLGDLTADAAAPAADLVLVGDLFYDPDVAARLLVWLRARHTSGTDVLIGDPWRAHLPTAELEAIATWRVSEATGAGAPEAPPCSVFRLVKLWTDRAGG